VAWLTLRAQAAPGLSPSLSESVCIEFPFGPGSALENKRIRERSWPRHTLVVGIRRGETELQFGDQLLILVPESRAGDVLPALLDLGTESA
jgi:hypothetical protein